VLETKVPVENHWPALQSCPPQQQWLIHVVHNKITNKGNAKCGVSPRLKIWPGDLDIWPWKSIGFQILLRTKYVPSLVKIHWRMLILECSQGCYGRTDGSITISLRNFFGEGIIKWTYQQNLIEMSTTIIPQYWSEWVIVV
jgi:hypothetical protein